MKNSMYRPTTHKKYVTILTVAVKDFENEQHFVIHIPWEDYDKKSYLEDHCFFVYIMLWEFQTLLF